MTKPFFENVEPIAFAGAATTKPLAFRYYDKDRVVRGKTMAEQLRFAVCYWHSFAGTGADVFGGATFERPWFEGEVMQAAENRLRAAFEFVSKLGVPFFTFHDRDVAPEADTLQASNARLDRMADRMQQEMERTGIRLLWGTANLFDHPRYMAGAATNPDPEVFAYTAAQVKQALEVTHRLDGENYVLWGGREGYETLLNTDLRRESQQLGRFLAMVAEHKHKLGMKATLLIEPKPHEPTKHQYDYDTSAVQAFLQKHGLEQEFKLNIEANHATLAGHSFQHEVAMAIANGLFGSIDINRGDLLLGWDTDQMPNDVGEVALVLYEILRAGGLTTGGFNFDAKLRRQSIALEDLFYAHIGGIDTVARGLLVAEQLLQAGELQKHVDERYAGWNSDLGKSVLAGQASLQSLAQLVLDQGLNPQPKSGKQELLENLVSRCL